MNLYMTGLARCGKDSLAEIIAKQLGFETYALAQPIKDIMCALFMWGDEHRDGSYKEVEMLYRITPDSLQEAAEVYKSYGLDEYEAFHDCWEKLIDIFGAQQRESYVCMISPRQAFQWYGTEWGRALDDEIWLKIAPTENVIITDVRFDNEAQFFKDRGFSGIKVVRPYFEKIVSSGHDSEKGVDPLLFEATVMNDKDLKELKRKGEYLASEIQCGSSINIIL